ncbi:PucR family transcriptional regulator [Streptomyces sp. NPDC057694]|uniref:PucR family transcriptional regulator n=1 Tax=Streptomyces sp. NPDC057694 TaxID=3346216 RepID=UPI00367F422D
MSKESNLETNPPPEALAILERLRIRVDAIARDSSADPLLDGMPADIARHELPLTARRYYSTVLGMIRLGESADTVDLDLARRRAAQRAEEGMPLQLVLHNWQHATRVLWQACVDAAGTELAAGLGHLGHRLYAFQEVLLGAVTESYQARQTALRSEREGAGRLIAQSLLAGQDPTEEAAGLGLTIAPRYAILTLGLPPLPASADGHIAQEVSAGRRIRALSTVLAHHSLLFVLEADQGQVLLPAQATDSPDALTMRADQLLDALRAETRLEVHASLTDPAPHGLLPEQAHTGHRVLHLARLISPTSPRRVHRIEDVALAYQLAHPTPARPLLAARIAPLTERPDLLATLTVWFDQDLDRARTAQALNVHPNTVNNRLRRIERLLDADLTSFTTLTGLNAALTIRADEHAVRQA